MRTRSLTLLSLLFLGCDHAPAQPDQPGSPAFSATSASASTRKAAPTLKAALRVDRGCSDAGNCTSYNIVSVDASDPTRTVVTVDPSIDLFASVVLVSGDTAGVATSYLSGFPARNVISVTVYDPTTWTPTYQYFSLVVF